MVILPICCLQLQDGQKPDLVGHWSLIPRCTGASEGMLDRFFFDEEGGGRHE